MLQPDFFAQPIEQLGRTRLIRSRFCSRRV